MRTSETQPDNDLAFRENRLFFKSALKIDSQTDEGGGGGGVAQSVVR